MRVRLSRVCKIASGAVLVAALLATSPSHAADPTDGFTLPFFPIGVPGIHAYNAPIVSTLDHSSTFYTQCCDTTITAYTGETVTRGASAFQCPAAPTAPTCFFTPNCICSYPDPEGDPFIVNGNYTGAFGPSVLRLFAFIQPPIVGLGIDIAARLWVTVAVIIAVRQALDFTTLRAIGTYGVGSVLLWLLLWGLYISPLPF